MKKLSLFLLCALLFTAPTFAQTLSPIPSTPVQAVPSFYSLVPISATSAVNAQTTLTIPAPASGLFNYVCLLGFNASQSATGAILSNQVTTSTNFNSFAIKFSINAVATQPDYDFLETFGSPATGCAKSTAAATATTFVSPAAAAQTAFTWYVMYFQAP
jgi:hypothetical protein